MVQGQRPQQWELKKREMLYTSNDESASTSSGEPIFKKLKPVSVLMSNETKQVRYHNGSKFMKGKKCQQSNKMQLTGHTKDADSVYSLNHKASYEVDMKNKWANDKPVSLDSNFICMQSILEELKEARENMFVWLRKEIRNIIDDEIPKQIAEEGCSQWRSVGDQHHNTVGSMVNVRSCMREV